MSIKEKLARLYAQHVHGNGCEPEYNQVPWEKLYCSERRNAEAFAEDAMQLIEDEITGASRRRSVTHVTHAS